MLDTCRQLEREGFEVTYLDPEQNGLLDLEKLKAAITDQTILISIMHVNNEIGVIQDIEAIGEIARERKIIFHVDAAQSTGKVDIDLERLKVVQRSQNLWPQGYWSALRTPQAARAPRSADARRRPRARHALGYAGDAPDRRHG